MLATRSWAPVLFIGLVCSSCGSGGITTGGGAPPTDGNGGGGDNIDPPVDTASSFAQKAEFDSEDGDHLLMRTRFGVTTAARAGIRRDGLEAFVDQMLTFPTDGSSDVEAEANQLLVNTNDPVGFEGMFPSSSDVAERWVYLMARSPHAFQERLALFLHDHFAVSTEIFSSSEMHWVVDYIDLLRNQGLGSFRDLVLQVSRSSAMLEWLDGNSSVKGEPNENFAREFFELFTVGADNGYVEVDIQEASRAFTGYRNRLDADTNLRYTEFDAERKDIFAKVLFDDVIVRGNGETSDDYEIIVDLTFQHLRVDLWLAEKLLLEFVSDEPTDAQIENLAAVIIEEEWVMRPILRRLFLSEAFFESRKSMIRNPVEFAVGFIRTTGLQVSANTLRRELEDVNQVPSQPPSVFGWPQGQEWLSVEGMVERANLVRRVIADRSYQRDNSFGVTMPASVGDSETCVDHFASLFDVELTDEERTLLVEYLDTDVQRDGSLEVEAFDPADEDHIDERVRGLFYILGNHVDAMTK